MQIEYVEVRNLEAEEKSIIRNISEKFASKLDRDVKNVYLVVRVKKLSKRGSKPQYDIGARVDSHNVIASARARDWDLSKALHEVYKKLESEIKHKFRTEGKSGRRSFKRAVRIKSRVV